MDRNFAVEKKHSFQKGIARVRRNIPGWLMILPCLWMIYIVIWNPTIRGMVLSLFEMKGYTPVEFCGLANYRAVMNDYLFVKTLLNTCAYVFWSLLLGYIPPIIVAVLLNEVVHLRGFFKFSIYIPVMLPSVAAALIWSFLYQPGDDGVLNMFLNVLNLPSSQWLQNEKLTIPLIVLFMTWKSFGSSVILYLASLQSVSQELYEACILDGASVRRKFTSITLPHLRGIMLLMLVRQIIGIFQIMSEPLAMTGGGPNNASLSLSLQGYYYAFSYFQIDKALALGVVTFAMLIVMTVFYFRLERKCDDM